MRRCFPVLLTLAAAVFLLAACSLDSSTTTPPDADKLCLSGTTSVFQTRSSLWGGQHISLLVTKGSAQIEFDCAHGHIGLMPDVSGDGTFTTRGTFTFEHGGPISVDEEVIDHPAYYSGTIDGDRMILMIRLTDTDQQFGPYELEAGSWGHVYKCL